MKYKFLILYLILPFVGLTQFNDEIILSNRNKSLSNIQNIDFDLDGQTDVVVAAWQMGKISWYKNLGGGNFSSEHTVINGGEGDLEHYEIADIDQDGDLDVIAPSSSLHKIVLLENDGTMTFNNVQVITTNLNNPKYVELKDLDNDTDLDLISTSSNKIAWYENQGGGIFGSQQVFSTTASYPEHCISRDLDNDGDNDIIFTEISNGRIYLIENFGNGSFGSIQSIASSISGIKDLRLSDVDSDNLIDVAYAFQGTSVVNPNGGISWIKNLGGNSFQAAQMISTNSIMSTSIELADLDNDSDIDLIYGINGKSSNGNVDSIVVSLNDGNQNFSISDVTSYYGSSSSIPSSISVSDLDGDGIPDISATSMGDVNRATWYKQTGAGQIGAEDDLIKEIHGPLNTVSKDINMDGLPDLIVISSRDDKISWYQNEGNGVFFEQQVVGYAPSTPLDIGAADFNNDGNIDIVSCGWYHDIYYFENTGGGNFNSGIVVGQDSLRSPDMHIADLNGDGESDIIIGSRIDNELAWYQSNGDGTFSSRNVITNSTIGVENIWSGDLDNDGDMDIIAAEFLGNKISYWMNDGNGNFSTSSIIDYITEPNGLTIADLNDDGAPDILATSKSENSIMWYENYGSGAFSEIKLIDSDAFEAADLRAADMDYDGDVDIVSISSSPTYQQGLSWYENLGDGQFSMANLIIDSVFYCSSILLNDLDLDGDQDIAYTMYQGDQLSYLLNGAIDKRQVRGQLYIDANTNQQFDTTDLTFPQIGINSSPTSSNTHIYNDGRYFIKLVDTTVYSIFPGTLNNWEVFSDSTDYTIDADINFSFEDSLDFGFYPSQLMDSLEIDGVGGLPRCNDTVNYWINFENVGTSIPSGIVSIELDDSLTYIDSDLIPDSIIGNTIYWSYDSLMHFSSEQILLHVQMPDFNSIGDTLSSLLSLFVIDDNGNSVYSSQDTLDQVNICAYDPNDKQSKPQGIDAPGYINPSTSTLEYTIRFQNTGNDTAMVVVIKDQLHTNLNWSSFEVLSSSHSMTHTINSSGEVTFSFSNIKLPDSTTNFSGSQGYVKFKIDLISDLPLGSSVSNSAAIYFDLNPPIYTNTKFNTLFDCRNLYSSLPSLLLCKDETFSFVPGISGTLIDWEIPSIDSGTEPEVSWLADTVGTYNLTMNATNSICTYDSIVSISVNPITALNILDTVSICSGDSINLFSVWRNTPGLYTSNKTNIYGCDSVIAMQLNVLSPIDTTLSDTIFACSGDSVMIFDNYETAEGEYFKTYSAMNGCDSVVRKSFRTYDNPNVEFILNGIDTLCSYDDPIILTGGTPTGGIYSGAGVYGNELDPSGLGIDEYQLIYTYENTDGCSDSDSAAIVIDGCLSIEKNDKLNVSIQPNPFTYKTRVNYGRNLVGNYTIQLLNSFGEIVLSSKHTSGDHTIIKREDLSSGSYLIKIINEDTNQNIHTERIIVK